MTVVTFTNIINSRISAMALVSWDELKASIRHIFSSENVDVDEVKKLMSSYYSDKSDWGDYEKFDDHT